MEQFSNYTVTSPIYPSQTQIPLLIFLPTRALLRTLIHSLALKDTFQTDQNFLLSFGLLEKPYHTFESDSEDDD